MVLSLWIASVRAQTLLWYHSMDGRWGWTGTGYEASGGDCVSPLCVYINKYDYIQNDNLYSSGYTDIVLEYSIRVENYYNANDYCAVYWSSDQINWNELSRYDRNSGTAFINESVSMGSGANDQDTLSIKLEDHSVSIYAYCFFDEVYLRGKPITSMPTTVPTYSMSAFMTSIVSD